jgi:hypothetical protein
MELQRNTQILQPLFESNCRGHSVDEIIEAIEQKIPPISGVPIRILWNPSPKVTPFLLAETVQEREQIRLEVNGDLRMVTVDRVESVRPTLLSLLNNAQKRVVQSVSYPNHASMRH